MQVGDHMQVIFFRLMVGLWASRRKIEREEEASNFGSLVDKTPLSWIFPQG